MKELADKEPALWRRGCEDSRDPGRRWAGTEVAGSVGQGKASAQHALLGENWLRSAGRLFAHSALLSPVGLRPAHLGGQVPEAPLVGHISSLSLLGPDPMPTLLVPPSPQDP